MNNIYLASNIRHLRKLRKISQNKLAETICVPRSTLNNWERGTAEPRLENIIQLADFFEIPVGDLIGTNTEYLKPGNVIDDVKVLAVTVNELEHSNVELVSSKAEAGYLGSFQDPEYIRELPRFSIPYIPHGNYRGFEIEGDSMLPVEAGSIVICNYVEKLSAIKDGATYIVVSNDGLVYKRVYKDDEKKVLLLISDNTLFKPYELPYEQVKEVWAYHAHLSFSNGKEIVDVMVEEKFKELNEKIDKIYDYISKESPE